MPHLPEIAWFLIVLMAAWTVIASLDALASRLRRDVVMHNLRVETTRLKLANDARLERIRRGEG